MKKSFFAHALTAMLAAISLSTTACVVSGEEDESFGQDNDELTAQSDTSASDPISIDDRMVEIEGTGSIADQPSGALVSNEDAIALAFDGVAKETKDTGSADATLNPQAGGGGSDTPPENVGPCGGIIAGVCPSGYECQDDPTDTCDPVLGGADCPGLCVKSSSGGDDPPPAKPEL